MRALTRTLALALALCQDDDHFGKLPWRHKDVISKYPASKKVIDAVLALPKVRQAGDRDRHTHHAMHKTVIVPSLPSPFPIPATPHLFALPCAGW